MKKKIKVELQGIVSLLRNRHISLFVLTNVAKTHQVAIICDPSMVKEFDLRHSPIAYTDDLLPEVLCKLFPAFNSESYEVLINSISYGNYKAFIIHKETLEMTPIRVSEALLLAQIAKLEIFIEEVLFMRQGTKYNATDPRMSLPLNALSMDMLQDALELAVADENYELASNLRDEIERRKNDDEERLPLA